MKRSIKGLLLIMALFTNIQFLRAQIQFESSYNHSGTYTQLAVSGYKFYLMDVSLNQCRIYNTDHSLWKTISLEVPVNQYLYDIKYLSEGLFTADQQLCLVYTYYAYDETNLFYTYTTRVVRENGSILLEIPGCQYYYVNDLGAEGTKLVTYSYDYSIFPYTIQTAVYHLPGSLNTGIKPDHVTEAFTHHPFPNPADEYLLIPQEVFDGRPIQVVLKDVQGKTVAERRVSSSDVPLKVSLNGLASGPYTCMITYNSGVCHGFTIIKR